MSNDIISIADRITALSHDERLKIMSKEKSELSEVNELKEIMAKLTTNNLVKLLTLVKSKDKTTSKKRKSVYNEKDDNAIVDNVIKSVTQSVTQTQKKKKIKKEKDPNAPKRPPNAYLLFSIPKNKELVDTGMDYKQAVKESGALWKTMDETAR